MEVPEPADKQRVVLFVFLMVLFCQLFLFFILFYLSSSVPSPLSNPPFPTFVTHYNVDCGL